MISMLSRFECFRRSSSLSMEEVEVFAIVNGIFARVRFLKVIYDVF